MCGKGRAERIDIVIWSKSGDQVPELHALHDETAWQTIALRYCLNACRRLKDGRCAQQSPEQSPPQDSVEPIAR